MTYVCPREWTTATAEGRAWLVRRGITEVRTCTDFNMALKAIRAQQCEATLPIAIEALDAIAAFSQQVLSILPKRAHKAWLSPRNSTSLPKGRLLSEQQHLSLSRRWWEISDLLSHACLGHKNGTGYWIWHKSVGTGKQLYRAYDRLRWMRIKLDHSWCNSGWGAGEPAGSLWDYYDRDYDLSKPGTAHSSSASK